MTFALVLTACLFAASSGDDVASRNDAGGDTASIYQLVRDTLDKARQSIDAEDLEEAAWNIQTAADAYIDANGGAVPAEEVQVLLDEIAGELNETVDVSAFFQTPLTYDASVLDFALALLDDLVETAEELETAGSSPKTALAGISMTAKATQAIVADIVGVVSYLANIKNGISVKRPDSNGGSYNIGVRDEHVMAKRNFSLHIGIGKFHFDLGWGGR